MTYQWLLVAHIAVLGYWLGAELVINANYRYVCYGDDLPFEVHSRLMSHVMDVDQHVRYALVLQTSLGIVLSVQLGYIPGGLALTTGVALFGVLWLGHFQTWTVMERDGPTPGTNLIIRKTYVRATSVLLLLWAFILAIVVLSVWRPM